MACMGYVTSKASKAKPPTGRVVGIAKRRNGMSYAQRGNSDPRYTPPFKLGYRHVGNSGKATLEEALADYQKGFQNGELVVERFRPDNRNEDDPLWRYTTKWAVYLKV